MAPRSARFPVYVNTMTMSEDLKTKLDALRRAAMVARDACGALESCRKSLNDVCAEYTELGERLMTDSKVLPAWRDAATKVERFDAEYPALSAARYAAVSALCDARNAVVETFYAEHVAAFDDIR